MQTKRVLESIILGAFLCAGLLGLGYILSTAAVRVKGLDRTVTVKGLSEREVPADIAIWPIKFTETENSLTPLYRVIQEKIDLIQAFLRENGFSDAEISVSPPAIVDRQAQGYDSNQIQFRYSGDVTISVYSTQVDRVRETLKKILDLGKKGIAITGQNYDAQTEYLFSGLNRIKPEMVEEATKNAREVAEKFATDSNSRLGKIKRASQGQFTIADRDSNTSHIKRVRVVSTIEYHLSD